MRFSVGKAALVAALGHLSAAAPTRGDDLNRCALLEVEEGAVRFSLRADLGLSLTVPAEVGLMNEWAPVAVPVALMHDLARHMPGRDVHLDMGFSGLQMSSGTHAVEVKPVAATADDWDRMRPDFTHAGTPVALNVADLRAALSAVAYASSSEAFQAVMRGVLIEFGPDRVRLVASDGFRLAVADLDASSSEPFTALPQTRLLTPALKALEGAEHCAVSVNDRRLIVRTQSASVSIPLLDGDYPDYNRIIPKVSEKTMTMPAATLAASIARVSVMADRNSNNRIDFLLDPERKSVRLCCEGDYGRGQDEHDMRPGGLLETLSTSFNSKYLLEALGSMKGDVTLDMGLGSRSPVRITSEARGVLAVVVPLRD